MRLTATSFLLAASIGNVAAHPLDPLSPNEIRVAVGVLREAGLIDRETRFPLIELSEPDKAAVIAWRRGQPVVRRALVIARNDRTVYKGVLDLSGRVAERWQAVPAVQSPFSAEEWHRASEIAMADPGWRQAMAKRGYTSVDRIFCTPLATGIVAPDEVGKRLAHVICFDKAGINNVRARPIEGLVATVDLDVGKVSGLTDTGPVPISHEGADFGMGAMRPQPPAPHGAQAFIISGHAVRWRGWSFHYRLDRRAGLIVSLVSHADDGRRRLLLYRGSLAELFVPYMDPDPSWSFRAWLDLADHGFGWLASPLTRGIDCPVDATMLDAVLSDDRGDPLVARSVICLFERGTGAPLWRHAESATRAYAGRPGHELVMRTIPSIGTYDYIIDWVLTEAGSVRIDVGATGIDAVKGVGAATMTGASAAVDTAHGMLVAPNLAAVYHDHFLSFRLDVDLDGGANTLMRQVLVRQPMGAGNTGRSLWTVKEEPVTQEGPVMHGTEDTPEVWRVINPNLFNRLGQHPGYELRPGHSMTSLLVAGDPAQQRAVFATAPLWVTAYDRRELYAAGDYPNQTGGGLPAYAAKHRPVENTDIVLWYTMGFHHLTRPEDWPVMPTQWHSVELVPYGFFDHNPSVPAPDNGD